MSRNSKHRLAPLLMAAVAAFVVQDLAVAQVTNYLWEKQTTKLPVDLAMSPNGKLAIARGHVTLGSSGIGDGIAVFDTATGNRILYQTCTSSDGLGGAWNPSDFIQATNSRAILVGGADTNSNGIEDKTYIDVLAFDMSSTPPGVTCLAHHELGTATSPQDAGYVSDVELTPDQTIAIVNSQNWIHVIDMGDGQILEAFNVGSPPYPGGACTPGHTSDSVVTTNVAAVVTQTRLEAYDVVYKSRCWVYLIDLAYADGAPRIRLSHNLSDSLPAGYDYDPHDIAITPAGTLAVVSAMDVVGFYDLTSWQFLTRRATLEARVLLANETVDSVVVTNERAVRVGKKRIGTGSDYLWGVDVFSLSPLSAIPLQSYDSAHPPPHGFGDVPHDLAMDGERAVVRTSSFALVLTDLQTPGPSDLVALDLHPYTCGNGQYKPPPVKSVYVSDSVLMIPPFVDTGTGSLMRLAATIGTKFNGSVDPYEAAIEILDIGASPPVRLQTVTVTDPQTTPRLMPTDLSLGPTNSLLVRCDASPTDPGQGTGGRDFLRIKYWPVSQIGLTTQIGASGYINGCVDSLEFVRGLALSISEDNSPNRGFVHFVLAN